MRLLIMTLTLCALTLNMTGQAHTGLTSSEPTAGQVLHDSPNQLRLQFSTPVRLIRLELLDNDGNPVELSLHQRTQAHAVFEIPVPELNAGSHTVNWVIMGADTHKMTGSFQFTVAGHSVD